MPIPIGYRAVAERLHARITSGDYPPGTKLPSYAELADEFTTSVSTVQRALLVLKERGLIIGVQGRGTYVRD